MSENRDAKADKQDWSEVLKGATSGGGGTGVAPASGSTIKRRPK